MSNSSQENYGIIWKQKSLEITSWREKYKIVFTFGLGRSEPKSLLPLSAAARTAVWEMVGQLSRSRDVHTNQLALSIGTLNVFEKEII
jgi:hypothetical protein